MPGGEQPPRGRGLAFEAIPPTQKVEVAELARRDELKARGLRGSPALRPPPHEAVSARGFDVCERAEEAQLAHAFGVGRGEHRRCRPALRNAPQRDPIRADGVEYRREITGPLVESWHARVAIGHPLAALVVHDDPREGRKPGQPQPKLGVLPHQLDVRDNPRQADEGDLAFTEDLEGDVHVAVSCIPRLGHPCGGVRHGSHAQKIRGPRLAVPGAPRCGLLPVCVGGAEVSFARRGRAGSPLSP